MVDRLARPWPARRWRADPGALPAQTAQGRRWRQAVAPGPPSSPRSARGSAVALLDEAEAAFGVVEPQPAGLGDRDDVFDPDPEPAGEVDARLDGEAHTGQQRLLLTLDHVWRRVCRRARARGRSGG